MNFQLPTSTHGYFHFFAVMGIKTRTLHILGKCHTTESNTQTPRVFHMKVLGHFCILSDTKYSVLFKADKAREEVKAEEHYILYCQEPTVCLICNKM